MMIALAIAAATHAAPDACSWAQPGRDPYRTRGELTRALADMNIDSADKALIKDKMERVAYTEIVSIGRDQIDGYANLRDMHSGHSTCHGPVKRESWDANHVELALVYCGNGPTCVAVPIVCDNVSLIDRVPHEQEPVAELEFAPPAAGTPVTDPAPAPVEDRSFAFVPDVPTGGSYGGGGFGGGDYGGGGGGGPVWPPHPPASGPDCGCKPPPPVCPPPPPPISSVPEPASLWLAVAGLLVLRFVRKMKKN